MRNLRSEKEIMQNWVGNLHQPLVSVCCIAYNHEPYIEDALEGFLIQETDFPFEIIIHDDASSDKTVEIIQEYQDKYPNIIKPMYQKENQFSKGVRISQTFNFKRAKGKYIALCEGDDYWTSSKKLQIQAHRMEENPDISLSFHDFTLKDYQGNLLSSNNYVDFIDGQLFSVEDVINKWFISTQSIMFTSKYVDAMDEGFDGVINGDWLIQLVCASFGKLMFINENMAVYRKHRTSLSYQVGKDKLYRCIKLILLFDSFDRFSNYKYSQEIERKKREILKELVDFETRENYKLAYYFKNIPELKEAVVQKAKRWFK